MCCKNYKEQTEIENREMLSQISHVIRESDKYFNEIMAMIRKAEQEGLFKQVKIGISNIDKTIIN